MEAYYVLLGRASVRQRANRQAFVIPIGDDTNRWQLPQFFPYEEIYNTEIPIANRILRDQFHLPTLTTRYALRLPEPALPGPLNIYVMDTLSRDLLASSLLFLTVPGRWIGSDELAEIDCPFPKQKAVLEQWFAEDNAAAAPALDLPWWREGWFAQTARETERKIADHGYTLLASTEQIRSASTAAILRTPTLQGDLYRKFSPAPFSQEPLVTQRLSIRYPDRLPRLIEIDGATVLMEEIGGRPFDGAVPIARWDSLVAFYATLQIESITETTVYLQMGCLDLRRPVIIDFVENLVDYTVQTLRGLPQQLTDEERQQLAAMIPCLQGMLLMLYDCGIPETLEHGDLHAGNTHVLPDTGFVLYDWSHACITIPFFGFGSLLFDDDWFPEQPDAMHRLEDAYLEPWSVIAPIAEMRQAFALWRPLRPLFVAAHQRQVIAAYQAMLGGRDYLPGTPASDALGYMQWWFREDIKKILKLCTVAP